MDESYSRLWEGLLAVEESRKLASTEGTPGFWGLVDAELPATLDDAIKKTIPRDKLLEDLTSGDGSETLGLWSTLKVQIFCLSMFERDCRARHSSRAAAYEGAVIEAEKRIASREFLLEELKAISEK